ncbi:MMPL family transporter [Sulfuriroseicoccus oceanibius]|uniref:MMPL family transporter n=1 Tax=Sulfuriroseicoccus oceanibius TaxID=2707525 RepID=A0A6B3LDW8_9BACT|nr:MMPL family transporter [Sulfuriroseicoccus oceanibius]QQL45475.1 MMPL family transporter [Sulfuriroseicoccus oceanibius]
MSCSPPICRKIATVVLLLLGVVLVFASMGVGRIRLDGDGQTVLPGGLPEVEGLKLLRSAFGKREEILLTLHSASEETTREAALDLTAELKAHDGLVGAVNDTEQLLTELEGGNALDLPQAQQEAGAALLAYTWLNSSDESMDVLVQRFQPEALSKHLAGLEEELQYGEVEDAMRIQADPLGFLDVRELEPASSTSGTVNVSSDGRYRLLSVRATKQTITADEAVEWVDRVKVVTDAWVSQRAANDLPQVTLSITGEPAYLRDTLFGMRRDLGRSVVSTTVLIMVLFALFHRRFIALLWLLAALAVVFLVTLGLAGWLMPNMSILSIGFAAILLGLAVDYGVVIFSESLTEKRTAGVKDLWRGVGPSVIWAAATTGAVFFALNFSSVPGISQLGSLVAIGIAVGAIVMLGGFAWICSRLKPGRLPSVSPWKHVRTGGHKRLWASPLIFFSCAVVLLLGGMPKIDRDFMVLRAKSSDALDAYHEMVRQLRPDNKPTVGYVISADTPDALWDVRRDAVEDIEQAQAEEKVASYRIAGRQVDAVRQLLGERERILASLRGTGLFDEAPIRLASAVFDAWDAMIHIRPEALEAGAVLNRSGLDRVFARHNGDKVALLGSVEAMNASQVRVFDYSWADGIQNDNQYLAGWEPIGPAVLTVVGKDFTRVFLPLGVVLLVMLAIVFRDWKDIALALAVMLGSGLALLAVMQLLDLHWNFINLCGIPLLFGAGLDFTIHMVFSLRRTNGHMPTVRRGMRKALLFCALSTASGFGSLALAGNMGVASLGRVCAIGILLIMVFAVYFLPAWWLVMHRERLKGMGGQPAGEAG